MFPGEEIPQPYGVTTGDYDLVHETRQGLSNELAVDGDLKRRTSIPRKQVGSSPKLPSSDNSSPITQYASPGHDLRVNSEKPLPSAPSLAYNSHQSRRKENLAQPPSVLDRSRPISRSTGEAYNAQDIVQRAQHDSSNTEIIERVAPGQFH